MSSPAREAIPLALADAALAAEDSVRLDDLAARTAAGNHAAFAEIYRLLADDLYLYLRGQCHDATDAEDILSTVFFKAWRSARSYRKGSRKFRPWIFAIARNELKTYWRNATRWEEPLTEDIADGRDGSTFDRVEAQRLILRCMRELTAEQREVVVLRFYGNLSHEEIGRIVGRREGAVRALLLRALRRMRKVVVNVAD